MTRLEKYIAISQTTLALWVAFAVGVIVSLATLGIALVETAQSERHIGQCEAACACRAYRFVELTRDDECICETEDHQTSIDTEAPAD